MAIKEVFLNPTVQQVIFAIQFPNFFSIESKIGEFQLKIMNKFPKSKLLFKQQFGILETINTKSLPPEIIEKSENPPSKIWQFSTESDDMVLNVTSSSLDISSKRHKTYNNEGVSKDEKFREIISFVVGEFLDAIPFPSFTRMGLRYVDKCPLPDILSVKSFSSYYNSSIDFKNIKVTDIGSIETISSEIVFLKENGTKLKYREVLGILEGGTERGYYLDFDGMAFSVDKSQYLSVLDSIHLSISECFENAIKKPVYEIMKKDARN
jgi:uncharacterized protein (TIGR04255 family)